jgi:HlyD family secretion protein
MAGAAHLVEQRFGASARDMGRQARNNKQFRESADMTMATRANKQTRWVDLVLSAGLGCGLMVPPSVQAADSPAPAASAASRASKPALSVQVVMPQQADWPAQLTASGAVAAWQEAVIGAELSGLRLSAVNANVGDVVKRGQVLATLQAESVQSDVTNARAALVEAQALLQEARGNADRSRALKAQDAISAQEAQRSLTAEQTAQARVNALAAQLASQELRLRQTRVVASDDGVISARQATLGAVAQVGQELFRLIRQNRLEWRAEMPSADLARIKPGMVATVRAPGGQPVQGKVRMVAPTVDASTRNGLVYVDLPPAAMAAGARAGMFASGQLDLGASRGLTLPQSAVLLRDGFSYVFKVSAQGLVSRSKVSVGRRVGERIEVTQGLDAQSRVVASGVGFLTDGDTVRVVKDPS